MVKAAAGYNIRPVLRTGCRLGTYKTFHWKVLGARRTRRTHGPEVRLRVSPPLGFAGPFDILEAWLGLPKALTDGLRAHDSSPRAPLNALGASVLFQKAPPNAFGASANGVKGHSFEVGGHSPRLFCSKSELLGQSAELRGHSLGVRGHSAELRRHSNGLGAPDSSQKARNTSREARISRRRAPALPGFFRSALLRASIWFRRLDTCFLPRGRGHPRRRSRLPSPRLRPLRAPAWTSPDTKPATKPPPPSPPRI